MAQEVINNLQSLITHIKLENVFKSLSSYINHHDDVIRSNITEIMEMYQPSNDLEKLLRLSLIDHYRCYDEVLNIFKGEDAFYVSHALRYSWFFENSNFNPQLLVDSVIPHMSYSTRLKVLKKYSKFLKDPVVATAFFKMLKQRYGLNTALLLLPACDEVFIKNILMTVDIKVPVPILSSLYCIHPLVVFIYLNHLFECASTQKRVHRTEVKLRSFVTLFNLFVSKEPKKFALLMEKYHNFIGFMKLGKRTTKQFVKTAFDSIIKNVNVYDRIFNWKFVVAYLSLEQISELQYAFFPKTVNDFFQYHNDFSRYMTVTSSLKKPISTQILLSNFDRAYNKPVTDFLSLMDLDLVKLLPMGVKENWVKSKLPKIECPQKKAKYIAHLSLDKSLPMLKEMIKEQPEVKVRAEIVNCMFETVIINNDPERLGDVCQYIVTRLRNERCIIRENALQKLIGYNKLIDVSDYCWKFIEEIINIVIMNNELNCCHSKILKIYSVEIYSRLKQNLSVDVYLDKLFKILPDYYSFDLCKNTCYEKQCLKWFLDKFSEEVNKGVEKEKIKLLLTELFIRICRWNILHKADQIVFPDWLIQFITECFKTEDFNCHNNLILKAIKKDDFLKAEIYCKIFPIYIDTSILTFNLHRDPELVTKYINDLMKKLINNVTRRDCTFFKQAKLYPLNLVNKIVECCIEVLKNGPDNDDDTISVYAIQNSIMVLVMMLPTDKFIEITSEFYPETKVVDDFSDEGKKLYDIQRSIADCLKYVDSPSNILDILSKFAAGDYLKIVVGSMNSIFLRVPEIKILPYLKQQLDCPVSLRKHFLRAYFRIAPIINTSEMYLSLIKNEENTSLRVLLFEHVLRFFLKEPCSETFGVLKAVFEKLQSSDDTVINKLLDIKNVPNEFISEYLQLLWDISSLKNETLVKDYRIKIINLIEPVILCLLHENFCDILISEVFDQNSMNVIFVVHYLLYSKGLEQLNMRFEKVMSGIERFLRGWNDFDLKADNVFDNRRTISFFINSLIQESFNVVDEAIPPSNVIEKVKVSLSSSLQESDITEEILHLDISSFFFNKNENSELMLQFCKFIEPIVDRMVASYGNIILDTIESVVNKILMWQFSSTVVEKYKLQLSETLFYSSSNNCFVFGLLIFPSAITTDILKYKELLSIISQNTDPTVKLFANKVFKKLSSSVNVE